MDFEISSSNVFLLPGQFIQKETDMVMMTTGKVIPLLIMVATVNTLMMGITILMSNSMSIDSTLTPLDQPHYLHHIRFKKKNGFFFGILIG